MKRNYAFDYYKFFFTLVIISHHGEYLYGLLKRGYIAVEFFFITSGLFLFQTHVKNPQLTSFQYLKKRAEKLYPGYLIAYLLILTVSLIAHTGRRYPTWYAPLTELLWVQNWGIPGSGALNYPLWYLSVLFAAGMIIFLALRNLPLKAFNFAAISVISVTYAWMAFSSPWIEQWNKVFGIFYIPFWRGLSDMLIGTLVFQAARAFPVTASLARAFEGACFLAVTALLIIPGPYDYLSLVLFVFFAYALAQECSFLNNFGSNRLHFFIVQYQYAMYLNHAAVILVFRKINAFYNMSGHVVTVLLLICVIFTAMLCCLIEKMLSKE